MARAREVMVESITFTHAVRGAPGHGRETAWRGARKGELFSVLMTPIGPKRGRFTIPWAHVLEVEEPE